MGHVLHSNVLASAHLCFWERLTIGIFYQLLGYWTARVCGERPDRDLRQSSGTQDIECASFERTHHEPNVLGQLLREPRQVQCISCAANSSLANRFRVLYGYSGGVPSICKVKARKNKRIGLVPWSSIWFTASMNTTSRCFFSSESRALPLRNTASRECLSSSAFVGISFSSTLRISFQRLKKIEENWEYANNDVCFLKIDPASSNILLNRFSLKILPKQYRAMSRRSDVEPEVAPTKWATTSHCSFAIARHAQCASSADLPAPASPETRSAGTVSSRLSAHRPVGVPAEDWRDPIGDRSVTRERRSNNWLTSGPLSMYCNTLFTSSSRPTRNYKQVTSI